MDLGLRQVSCEGRPITVTCGQSALTYMATFFVGFLSRDLYLLDAAHGNESMVKAGRRPLGPPEVVRLERGSVEALVETMKTEVRDPGSLRAYWASRLQPGTVGGLTRLAKGTHSPALVFESVIMDVVETCEPEARLERCLSELTRFFGLARLIQVIESLNAWLDQVSPQSGASQDGLALIRSAEVVLANLNAFGLDSIAGLKVYVEFDSTLDNWTCILRRDSERGLGLYCSGALISIPTYVQRLGWLLSSNLLSMLALLDDSVANGRMLSLYLGDGIASTATRTDDQDIIAFCCAAGLRERVWLLADPYVHGAASLLFRRPEPLSIDAAWSLYKSRREAVYWRGSTTGPYDAELPSLRSRMISNQRVRFCLEAQIEGLPFDAEITAVVQVPEVGERERWEHQLAQWGILGPSVPEEEFLARRYFVDLDGNSAAWGALRKYLGLCLVLKPASDWLLGYHRLLVPQHNFVPVESANLSDVAGALAALDMQERFRIAHEGHLMAHKYLRRVLSDPAARLHGDRLTAVRRSWDDADSSIGIGDSLDE